ncbi:MAG: tetratricopeptide repeat protein [Chitinophagales bacterium]
MAKQKKQTTGNSRTQAAVTEQIPLSQDGLKLPSFTPYLIIFLFSILLYSNTLWNKYAIDDTIVLTDNKFTKKGFGGIKDHFTHDMFEGFFGERGAKLVSGGRYRPLSMVSLTVEYEISRKLKGDKRGEITDQNIIMGDQDPYLFPFLNHAVNILLFAFTTLLLYYILLQILPSKLSLKSPLGDLGVAFFATMLYAAHPIHTEAVSNVKGRDEVMCMLFSLLALLATIKYAKTKNVVHLIWGMLIFFVALMSKENAITFFAVIPLTYFFFTNLKAKDYAITIGLYLIPAALFLFLRSQFTQSGLTQDSPEILNNPFLLATTSQRYATVVLTFLYYFKLLVFPHPLTHDYYFNQIPYVDVSDFLFILSFIVNAALVVYALMNLKKKTIASYAILFYFITFSIASNVLFTVGVLMNERFIYMSSLGFCILAAYLVLQYIKNPKAVAAIFFTVLSLYSAKTFTRNYDWKDSFTLFRKDSHHSTNSAKIQTSLGGDLTKAADSDIQALRDSGMIKTFFSDLNSNLSNEQLNAINMMPDSSIRYLLLDSSIAHLNEAIRIYQTHSNAWLLLGNAVYKRYHNPQQVIPIYEKASAYRVGGYYDASFNLGVVCNESNVLPTAKQNLLKAVELKPEVVDSRYLLSQVYAKLNQPDSVEYWLQKASAMRAPAASDYYQIGTGFGKVGHNLPMAIVYLNKAIEMAPKVELYYEDLGVAYGLSGRFDEAIATSEKLVQLNPKYPAAYLNLSVSYRNKGNKQLADQYLARYNELMASYKNAQ